MSCWKEFFGKTFDDAVSGRGKIINLEFIVLSFSKYLKRNGEFHTDERWKPTGIIDVVVNTPRFRGEGPGFESRGDFRTIPINVVDTDDYTYRPCLRLQIFILFLLYICHFCDSLK